MFRYLILLNLVLFSSCLIFAQNLKNYDSLQFSQKSKIADTIEAKTSGPNIIFDNTSHEIDTVKIGAELSYTFSFTNNGNQPLLISNVRTNCNCTVASFPKTPILPGNTERIELNLDTRKNGSFAKVVAVYSNAKDKPRTILHIKWHVFSAASKTK